MCGRKYAKEELNWAEYRDALDILHAPPNTNFQPNYNIAPTHIVPVCISEMGERRLVPLQWGLVPFWAKDARIGYKMINARSETLEEKPSFRSLLKSRRCVVPISGFYEWKREGKAKQAYKIEHADGHTMMLAGLWAENGTLETQTYTVVTTAASDTLKSIHHRMPVILDGKEALGTWLEGDWKDAKQLTRGYSGELSAVPIDNAVGNVRNNYPELLEPLNRLV